MNGNMAELLLFLQWLLIFTLCACYVLRFYRQKSVLQLALDCSLLALIFGTPILFTSLTRSVFEVTKMGLLRYSQLVMLLVLFLSYVFKMPVSFNQTASKSAAWQKIHWLWLAWTAANLLSFVFSPNHFVAWLGAYDRWEGIVTVTNYIVLFYLILRTINTREQMLWCGVAFMTSGLLTTIYGAFQSTGHDFMNWSVDPTARVFASINNPVHYSAYVAMLVPVFFGAVFYWLKTQNIDLNQYRLQISSWFKNPVLYTPVLLLLSGLFFYYVSSFLSFGRATWIGFSVAMMFFYFFLLKLMRSDQPYFSTLSYLLGMLLAIAVFVFKVHEFSKTALILILLMGIVFLGLLAKLYLSQPRKMISILAVLVFFSLLQFDTVSLPSIFMCLVCAAVLYWNERQQQYFKVSLGIMLALMAILVLPSINNIYAQTQFNRSLNAQFSKLEKEKARKLTVPEREQIRYQAFGQLSQSGQVSKTELNVTFKTSGYSSSFKTGTARTSMWRSAIGLSLSAYKDPNFHMWIKDYPLLGTGPCTIKCFFPRYRRPEYGRLEGGHNFTPDKLHNDYVNLIATNGLVGFTVYYLLFLPYCGYLFIKRLKDAPDAPSNYILMGLIAGVMVYQGQVMFNFGVVATRVLFYELLGLAMALILNDPFGDAQKSA